MRDKYLGREGIIEKYDSRNFIINSVKYGGAVGGLGFVVMGLGSDDIRMMVLEGGAGSFLYFVGDRLYKLNEKMKEKALKNLEQRSAA
jgi:hypothetical protein